ncbi:MAG: chemotaxis protein CheW [Oceanospirillaceae bacterium]|nr:chemotaxis protein CheW [Oceanospirillaceae bacterium]
MTAKNLRADAEGGQYLSFLVDNEEYAVDILRVQEVRGWTPVTRIPNSPGYLKGVLNLRGAIVPVVDMRERFGFPVRTYDPTTVVVVVKVLTQDRERVMGLVVDAVYETYHIAPSDIRTAPELGTAISSDYIGGLAAIEERMVVILDIDRLMNSRELAVEPALVD